MRTEVRFAGFGGQGIISAAKISGRAATVHDNLNAVLTQSYGPEARGGACSANVVISQDRISYPNVTTPNILVIMSQEAYTTFGSTIAKGGTLIVDEDLVSLGEIHDDVHLYKVPATKLAEGLGNRVVANVVMLGAIVAITGMVSKDAMLDSVQASVPPRFCELNKEAFEEGYDYGRKLKS
jgi:2-oxoglutarate ferredoxin oxidoreductase subunit gamma